MISLLVINFRAARLALDAIRTARESSSAPLHVVVVDNSLDTTEAGQLRDACDVLLVSHTNRGYAGGINDGLGACRGDRVIISNPDVLFADGAIDRLTRELSTAAITGPALYWDDAHRWHLPPGDLGTARERLDRILASRSVEWRRQWDSRRIAKRISFWRTAVPKRVAMLSGAVLAVRRDVIDRVGPFDERFALYFEENDFLRRVAEQRLPIVHVPAARCRHIYDQSASQVAEESAVRFAQSEMRYLEKWNGPLAARALRKLERPLSPLAEAVERSRADPIVAGDGMLVEASPLPTFATAAGAFASGGAMTIPGEILATVRGDLYARVVDLASRRAVATYKITA